MAWTCPRCAFPIADEMVRRCPVCATDRPTPGNVVDGARRDVKMEAHLRAIGLWHRVEGAIGAGVVLVGVVAIVGGIGGLGGKVGAGEAIVIGVLALFLLACAAAYFMLGHYLARYYNGARLTAGVLVGLGTLTTMINGVMVVFSTRDPAAIAMAVLTPLPGLAWSLAQMWALFNDRAGAICTAEYRALVARSPGVKVPLARSPFLWVPFAVIALWLGVGAMVTSALWRLFTH